MANSLTSNGSLPAFTENAFIKGIVLKKMALQNFNGVFLNEKEKREREESTCWTDQPANPPGLQGWMKERWKTVWWERNRARIGSAVDCRGSIHSTRCVCVSVWLMVGREDWSVRSLYQSQQQRAASSLAQTPTYTWLRSRVWRACLSLGEETC